MIEEKSTLEQRSFEAEQEPVANSLKQKDEENTPGTRLPQSDDEYNVTLKTWCVVLVSILRL
jgi:hypothetical protein